MKASLRAGLEHRLRYRVPASKTVPFLFAEASEFQQLPPVLATGYLVGLLEWACMRVAHPHLDAGETTVGIRIDASHCAATPPGMEVEVHARLIDVDGRRLVFDVSAHDGIERISSGTHQRHVVSQRVFATKARRKALAQARVA